MRGVRTAPLPFTLRHGSIGAGPLGEGGTVGQVVSGYGGGKKFTFLKKKGGGRKFGTFWTLFFWKWCLEGVVGALHACRWGGGQGCSRGSGSRMPKGTSDANPGTPRISNAT